MNRLGKIYIDYTITKILKKQLILYLFIELLRNKIPRKSLITHKYQHILKLFVVKMKSEIELFFTILVVAVSFVFLI